MNNGIHRRQQLLRTARITLLNLAGKPRIVGDEDQDTAANGVIPSPARPGS
jgi:hypothetical protein